MKRLFYGPLSALGLAVALAALALDQMHKTWSIFAFHIAERQPVPLVPFLDMVLVWNKGVSYSLFEQDSQAGRWALVAFKVIAAMVLAAWLARIGTRIGAVGLGLIIGGALGNAVDRTVYGAVADFFYFHVGSFNWYVFNLADVAIVAGVGLLLYETLPGKGRPGSA